MDSMDKPTPAISPTALTALGSDESGDALHVSIESTTTTTSSSSSSSSSPTAVTPHADKLTIRGRAWRGQLLRSIRPLEATWMALYLCTNGVVFALKARQYEDDASAQAVYGRCVVAARGAAACINFNCLLILLPVCRHLIATLRASSTIQRVVPIDRHLKAHVMIGSAILVFTVIHVGGQVCNAFRFSTADEADIHELFGPKMAHVPSGTSARWTYAFTSLAGWTGVVLTALMLVAYPLTLVRRTRYNLFWSSHQLLLLMLVIMCVHGTASMLEPYRSLAWTIGPLTIYLLFRVMREAPALTRASLLSANLLPGGVVHLRLSKPRSWGGTHVHKPGMMGMVKIPQLSALEWHPFSLTSLPSDEHLEFHMKVSGDWTTKLHERLAPTNPPSSNALTTHGQTVDNPRNADVETPLEYFPRTNSPGLRNEMASNVASNLTFLVDGPMSSATQSYADHPAVVLIGSGIGITPAISVLKHVATTTSSSSHFPSVTRRVYFFWVVRNAECLDWFARDLDKIISRQHDRRRRRSRLGPGGSMIETRIRCYVTGTYGFDSSRTFAVGTSEHMIPSHSSDDAVTPTLSQVTRSGRPNWMDELREVQSDALSAGIDRCKIFICGSAPLVQEVSRCADSLCHRSFRYSVAYENFLMA